MKLIDRNEKKKKKKLFYLFFNVTQILIHIVMNVKYTYLIY